MDLAKHPHPKGVSHQRTILHLDMDCFYAQVEEIRNPSLRNQPVGVQQKNIVVTCNYLARTYGVTKLMLVDEAKRLCSNLVLVNGEDLTPYRHMSQKIFDTLLKYTTSVEKLGLDENFLDLTVLVEQRQRQFASNNENNFNVEGHMYPVNVDVNTKVCNCGCAVRLAIGSRIAKEIRHDLFVNLGVTCCAGIAFNKLLAKLVGARNKPNQQTVLLSSYSEQFMRELFDLHRITGIGQKTTSLLIESGISNIEELQKCNMDILRKKFGYETALKLKDLAFGRDTGAVRTTGKPKTIGLEDSCKPISVRNEAEERFRLLLMRLMEQVAEDGRIPICIKIILRKFDAQKKSSHRETKQANILPSLFKVTPCTNTGGPKVILADDAQEKLLKIIMRLFDRVVDMSKSFNITLIGLAFSKFQQRKVGSSSIANFLIKKTNLEVQSITSLINTDTSTDLYSGVGKISSSFAQADEHFRSSPTTFKPSDQFHRRRNTTASPISMLFDNGSESAATNSDFSDISETEVEPSPKKSRLGRLLLNKRHCLGATGVGLPLDAASDMASPSKLRVCDLRLNSHESDRDVSMSSNTIATTTTTISSVATVASSVANTTSRNNVYSEITDNNTTEHPNTQTLMTGFSTPTVVAAATEASPTRSDSLECFRKNAFNFARRRHSYASSASTLPSPMDDSSSSDSMPLPQIPPNTHNTITHQTSQCDDSANVSIPHKEEQYMPVVTTETVECKNVTPATTITTTKCPAGVDPQVFNELPLDVQNELIASWRTSLALAISNGSMPTNNNNNNNHKTTNTTYAKDGANGGGGGGGGGMKANNSSNGAQRNTLYRYFMRDK